MSEQKVCLLDLAVRRDASGQYQLELRLNDPNDDAVHAPSIAPCGPFDPKLLVRSEWDSGETGAYGKLLGAALLGQTVVRDTYRKARAVTDDPDIALRIRLFVEPSAVELNALRWETLADPDTGEALFNGDNIYFSRLAADSDSRAVRIRAKTLLRALVAIANPSNLDQAAIQLAPVDVATELSTAKLGLGDIPITALASELSKLQPGIAVSGRASLEQICDTLRDGAYDILYIVCHGAMDFPQKGAEPVVLLENKDDGTMDLVAASRFVLELKKLSVLPRLLVLASCQSAGTGKSSDAAGALNALAPRLADAGIPAIVAMQGAVPMDTVKKFMPIFFKQVRQHGFVDRAMSVARGRIDDDFWRPVLYMRLRDGCLWYVPGFSDDSSYQRLPALVDSIKRGNSAPILGPLLLEKLFGDWRELTRVLATASGFPLLTTDTESLPSVAQYISIVQKKSFMRHWLKSRLAAILNGDEKSDAGDNLQQLLSATGKKSRADAGSDPHNVLASCPTKVFISATRDTLLEDALREQGKTPRTDFCRWRPSLQDSDLPNYPPLEPGYLPDAQHPLVYHLFGLWDVEDSLVLTEDDFFDYLLAFNKDTTSSGIVPAMVRRALVDSDLLFLGFRPETWEFRVLYRCLMSLEGRERSSDDDRQHVAAQIRPEDGRTLDPRRARSYFEEYFKPERINIYWGGVEDFVRDLDVKMHPEKAQAAS